MKDLLNLFTVLVFILQNNIIRFISFILSSAKTEHILRVKILIY